MGENVLPRIYEIRILALTFEGWVARVPSNLREFKFHAEYISMNSNHFRAWERGKKNEKTFFQISWSHLNVNLRTNSISTTMLPSLGSPLGGLAFPPLK